jgi:hypothetical protein
VGHGAVRGAIALLGRSALLGLSVGRAGMCGVVCGSACAWCAPNEHLKCAPAARLGVQLVVPVCS